MAPLQRTRYLTCFYCGRKSSTPYDGKTRHFECIYCDADNFLDENGDVADPPVATDKIATPARFAVPRPSSPPASPTTAPPIFCNTCLKNQHLLSASLAQYLPDPDDPEYDEAEKNFHRFRQTQERLYPQICAECEPKVRQRLDQAAYTAKTDILRRMIDHNADIRKNIEPSNWLEMLDTFGKSLWIAGFVLQLVYHVSTVHMLFSKHNDQIGTESLLFVLRVIEPVMSRLPSAAWFLSWSTRATIAGAWWNPRFAQVVRGFRKHISGVTRWYIYQVMAILMRICLQRVEGFAPSSPELFHIQIMGHALLAGFALLLFIGSSSAIHTKVSPILNGSTQPPLRLSDTPINPSTIPPPVSKTPADNSKPDAIKSMVDLLDELDEVARSPPPSSPVVPPSPSLIEGESPFILRRPRQSHQPPMGYTHTLAARDLTNNLQQINSLQLGGSYSSFSSSFQPYRSPPSIQSMQSEEMDWSPTPGDLFAPSQSQHRAFATQGLPQSSSTFGKVPVEPRNGPFWYRVPPAPTTPAQRIFNTARRGNQPLVPAGRQEIKFRGPDKTQLVRETRSQTRKKREQLQQQQQQQQQQSQLRQSLHQSPEEKQLKKGQQALAAGVTFAEPKLFANSLLRGDDNDPREDLTTLFGGSFSMDEENKVEDEAGGGGWFGGGGWGIGKNNTKSNNNNSSSSSAKKKTKKKS